MSYPDNGGEFEDRNVLRNAVVFTTAQRASRAFRLLQLPLEQLSSLDRAFLAVETFDLLVVSLEDEVPSIGV